MSFGNSRDNSQFASGDDSELSSPLVNTLSAHRSSVPSGFGGGSSRDQDLIHQQGSGGGAGGGPFGHQQVAGNSSAGFYSNQNRPFQSQHQQQQQQQQQRYFPVNNNGSSGLPNSLNTLTSTSGSPSPLQSSSVSASGTPVRILDGNTFSVESFPQQPHQHQQHGRSPSRSAGGSAASQKAAITQRCGAASVRSVAQRNMSAAMAQRNSVTLAQRGEALRKSREHTHREDAELEMQREFEYMLDSRLADEQEEAYHLARVQAMRAMHEEDDVDPEEIYDYFFGGGAGGGSSSAAAAAAAAGGAGGGGTGTVSSTQVNVAGSGRGSDDALGGSSKGSGGSSSGLGGASTGSVQQTQGQMAVPNTPDSTYSSNTSNYNGSGQFRQMQQQQQRQLELEAAELEAAALQDKQREAWARGGDDSGGGQQHLLHALSQNNTSTSRVTPGTNSSATGLSQRNGGQTNRQLYVAHRTRFLDIINRKQDGAVPDDSSTQQQQQQEGGAAAGAGFNGGVSSD